MSCLPMALLDAVLLESQVVVVFLAAVNPNIKPSFAVF